MAKFMDPMISVVIPCRNEVNAIGACVAAIFANDYSSLEVLVVDGMSTDGTRELLEKLKAKYSSLRVIDNPQALTPFAFNLGVKNARGEYIQIVGSRNILAPDYLRLLKQALDANPGVACVGGDYQHVYDSDAGRLVAAAMESRFGVGGSNYRTKTEDTFVDTVGVPMYRRAIFNEVGYFDENLTRNQDDDFNFRVTQRGGKILYVHAAKVTYLVRGSLTKAFNQFKQYGYFKVFVNKKHKAVTTSRQLVPAAFVAFLFLGLPWCVFSLLFAQVYGFILVMYLVTGFALAGRGLSIIDRLRVVSVCFVLHLGYGLGYWQGILDFLIFSRAPRENFQRQTT